MPWKEASLMDLRKEFIHLATQNGAKIGRLCRRFKISSKTAYKWICRFRQEGEAMVTLTGKGKQDIKPGNLFI